MSRYVLRVQSNGRVYAAGHDVQLDDDRVLTFPWAEGATDILTVDWRGWAYGAVITAAWQTTGGTLSSPTVSGSVARVTFSGLSEGQGAEIKCTATASGRVGVVKFRIMSPVGLIGIASIGVGSSGYFIEAEEGPLEP